MPGFDILEHTANTFAHGALLRVLDKLLDRMLSPDQAERPPTAVTLLEAIETIAQRFQIPLEPTALSRHIEDACPSGG